MRLIGLLRGLAGPALAAALFVALTAVPAWAHIALAASSPAQGSSIPAVPSAVELEFTGKLQDIAEVVVIGPDGDDLAAGEATVTDRSVSQMITAGGGEGQYALAYRITSADGHVLTGRVAFAVSVPFADERAALDTEASSTTSGAEAGTGSPGAATAASSGPPTSWPARDVVIPAVLLTLAAAAWAWGRRTGTSARHGPVRSA